MDTENGPTPARGYYYPDDKAPYVTVHVRIPELGQESHLGFLIATGSAITTIMPANAQRLGIQPDDPRLTFETVSHRPGLLIEAAPIPAQLAFLPDHGDLLWQDITLYVVRANTATLESPSFMGVDALRNMRLEISPNAILITPTGKPDGDPAPAT